MTPKNCGGRVMWIASDKGVGSGDSRGLRGLDHLTSGNRVVWLGRSFQKSKSVEPDGWVQRLKNLCPGDSSELKRQFQEDNYKEIKA